MTIRFNNIDDTYPFFVNGNQSTATSMKIISMHSNTELIDIPLDLIDYNDRYTHFEFTLTENLGDQHLNGIYSYVILDDTAALVSGVVKVITEPGGETGTEAYISNNENREAIVYIRPAY